MDTEVGEIVGWEGYGGGRDSGGMGWILRWEG